MMALFRKIVPKKSPEEVNDAAIEYTRQLHNARFTFRPFVFAIGMLPPLGITILELTNTGITRWLFGIFDLLVVTALVWIFITDRAIVNSPASVAAKSTRVTKTRRRRGGYVIHYAFSATDGSGHTGSWHAQWYEGDQYTPGMLIPVLYDRSKPERNVAWGKLSFYKTILPNAAG